MPTELILLGGAVVVFFVARSFLSGYNGPQPNVIAYGGGRLESNAGLGVGKYVLWGVVLVIVAMLAAPTLGGLVREYHEPTEPLAPIETVYDADTHQMVVPGNPVPTLMPTLVP